MKIRKIYIKNFRSIKKEIINFNNPLYPLSLVGENNVGKTNILKALDLFFSNTARDLTKDDFLNPEDDMEVVIRFYNLNKWEKINIGEANLIDEELYVKQVGKLNSKDKLKYFSLRVKKEGESGSEFIKSNYEISKNKFIFSEKIENCNHQWFPNPAGASNFLSGFLPEFLYVSAIDDVDNELKIKTNNLFGEIISKIIKKLEGSNETIREIKKNLEDLSNLPEIKDLNQSLTKELQSIFQNISFNFEITSPDFFKIIQDYSESSIEDEIKTKPKLKGEGVQRAIIYSIFKVYSEVLIKADVERERSLIFAIEEPELYLHPHKQKVFLEALKTIARGGETNDLDKSDQILYTTHSPNLVEIKEYGSVLIIKKEGGETAINQINEKIFGGGDKDKEEFKLAIEFDPERNSLFFAKEVILVEGDTEKVSIKEMADKIDLNLDYNNISIVECGGKNKTRPFIRILNGLQIPYTVIIDEDPVKTIFTEEIFVECDNCKKKVKYMCEECNERIKSKNKESKSSNDLNEIIKKEINEEIGDLNILSPDFEGVCQKECSYKTPGHGQSKPFNAYNYFKNCQKEDMPKTIIEIIEDIKENLTDNVA